MNLFPSVPEKPPSKAGMDAMWEKNTITPNGPALRTDTIYEVARRLVQAIEEAEACIQMGVPELAWNCWAVLKEYHFGHVKNSLAIVADHPELLECPKRQEWLESALTRFLDYLAPPQIQWLTEYKSGKFTVTMPDHELVLQKPAIIRQRYWGIGFYNLTKKRSADLARLYLAEATGRLASDITSINRFCREWPTRGEFLQTVSFSHERIGNQFEHLILCVLNHFEEIVEVSSLYQDVCFWSDFRVIRSGAMKDTNIQVKFIHNLSDQEIADHHPKAKETIILSPASLAEFIEHSFDAELFGCSWTEFLEIFPRRAYTTAALGTQLYHWFAELLSRPRTHPMSPLSDIPLPIFLGIHLFVAHSAATIQSKTTWRQAALKAAESIRTTNQKMQSNASSQAGETSLNQSLT
jgi:hypothetical protein